MGSSPRLECLQLQNFRSYSEKTVEFEPVTLFVGPNGIGKTNILEAVGYLALARSFRTRLDREVIHWGESVARLVGKSDESTLEVILSQQAKGGKIIKINGVNRRAIELLGHLAVVLFLPESLQLIDGAPHLRRQLLDLLLVQLDRRYAFHLLAIQKVLRQRNRLLRQIDEGQATADQLVFWNESLVEHGAFLAAERVKILNQLNNRLSDYYAAMSGQTGKLLLRYRAASVSESAGEQAKLADPGDCPTDSRQWGELLSASLDRYQSREIAAGATLYGPQRDDVSFLLNDRPLAHFGSRGEFRSAVLALKAAEADILSDHLVKADPMPPLVFLLDDVYSELDEGRRGRLAELIGQRQAIITTTDLSHLDTALRERAKIITMAAD